MKPLSPLAALGLIALLQFSLASAQTLPAAAPADSSLARQILQRGAADQAIRDTAVRLMQAGQQVDSALILRMNAVDSGNTAWLKALVGRRGWPGRSMVGADAAHAAFLVVQHAVRDTGFQASALNLMEPGVASGDVDGKDVALLADRLDVQRGRPQRFGTQARLENGRIIFHPIVDSVRVDKRRAALGLPPLAEYASQLESAYTSRTTATPSPKETAVTTRATGTFDVKVTPQAPGDSAEAAWMGRLSLAKQFHGDIEGAGSGLMLGVQGNVEGSAGYVAVERISGTVNGKRGSFVLQHNGHMSQGAMSLTIGVVPDSGTGELTGLAGTFKIIIEGAKHSYEFDYTLPAAP